VDQDHADEMRRALTNLNQDLVSQYPDYVCRVTSNEGDIGRGHLGRFQELETETPAILTTSQMLTTGVDAPTCKNVVLARVVGSMSEFKQIIGRGTRVRDDYGKLWFSILDYTGSATRLFADKDFDGDPAFVSEEKIDAAGATYESTVTEETPVVEDGGIQDDYGPTGVVIDDTTPEPRKYFVDGGQVAIAAHLVYELDPDGKQLRVVKYSDYAADKVRTLFPGAIRMREQWANPRERAEVIRQLEERGINFNELADSVGQPEADPFDLLCHLAFNAPLRTRRERAERLKHDRNDFFDHFSPEARAILEELLEKYAQHGTAQFVVPDILKVPPISERGNVIEIAGYFGGAEKLREAVNELQTLLYAEL
jgi:type I restriction enzyme R subunit